MLIYMLGSVTENLQNTKVLLLLERLRKVKYKNVGKISQTQQ